MQRTPSFETEASPRPFWCRTLGRLALYRAGDDRDALMLAGKPLALLVYVALAPGQRVDRDRAAELLWPLAASSDPRHSLRQALYRLRAATDGAELVQATDGELMLRPVVGFDCQELEAFVADDDPDAAAGMQIGHFLGDFAIPESREFEDWVESQSIRFEELWAEAAVKLARQQLAEGSPEEVIPVAERLAALRPFDEEPVQLLMGALAAAGRHAIALSRFAAFADLLSSEEDAEPSERLRDYAAELQNFVRFRTSMAQPGLPFVGRTEQWAVLEQMWAEATVGTGSTVLIEGAAGLGKTRLIEELRARVQSGEGLVLSAKCYQPEQSVPYGAIAEALSTLVSRPALGQLSPTWLSEAARLLPELHEQYPSLPDSPTSEGSEASKRRLHQALARCLEAVAKETPVLLTLDDLHWADPASLEVLHSLTHHLRNRNVMVLTTYRPAELNPAARSFARSLCASALARLLVLEPLSESEVSDLLVSLATFDELELQTTVCAQLHRQSGGSPLFLAELLDALSRDGTLFRRDDQWVWSGQTNLSELPKTIGKLLADRIDRLEPWMRACVECLAVAADDVSVDLLARAVGISAPRADLALSVLEAERLTKRTGTEAFELIHDEFRRLVYHGIPDQRRAILHAAVGTALADLGAVRRPGGAARLVYHFDQAGSVEDARRYALLAAGEASRLSAPDALRAHLEMAAAHSPRPLPPRSRAKDAGVRLRNDRGPVRLPLVVGSVLAAVVVTALAAGWVLDRAGPPAADYRQGNIYLSASGELGPTHRVVWPTQGEETAQIEPLSELPEPFSTAVFVRPVSAEGETHTKLFQVVGSDTVQLTSGRSDDGPVSWSPDGREILIQRGWRSEEWLFTTNLFRLRLADGRIQQVTDTRYQDAVGTWSPTGARLAFRRDSLGTSTVWVADYDGGRPVDLSTRLGLPLGPSVSGFSPDGKRLALLFQGRGLDPAEIFVADLGAETARMLVRLEGFANADRIAWSPDGDWLVFAAMREGRRSLWLTGLDGTTGIHHVVTLPEAPGVWGAGVALQLAAWSPEMTRHVQQVRISRSDEVSMYRGLATRATARDQRGDSLPVPIRWSVIDTAIANVDEVGFVRGRAEGSTRLIASTGGFRADTTVLTVGPGKLDTLLVEDWTHGVDPERWQSFGNPQPLVLPEVTGVGMNLFLNNGDYNHASGVFTNEQFETLESGLTIEADGWLGFTGDHWQYWELDIPDAEVSVINDREVPGRSPGLGIHGHSPVTARPIWACGGVQGEWTPDEISGTWSRYAVQLRPDGYLECYRDGRLLAVARVPEVDLAPGGPVRVLLAGASEGTGIYHRKVVVLRGLRY